MCMCVAVESPYDIFACEAFARNGLRPYTSPAEQVIADFIARGISVDQLYCMLADMDAWGCMEVLEDHGELAWKGYWMTSGMPFDLCSVTCCGTGHEEEERSAKVRS